MTIDPIKCGDRVSWRLDGDSRHYGTVVEFDRVRPLNFTAFRVIDTMGVHHIIPARFITKEVG